ncbi:MAG TPA: DUF937 domain-containing protein [Gammaproteobacteria bacterium]|nr:DUF937 domain-containing protein [Gammaproteobacteria bacterium]
MNILDTILQSQGGALVRQLAGTLGIDERSLQSVMGQVVPALARGIQRNAASQEGSSSLFDALARGNHQRYLERPESLADRETQLDGNAILGHIFGSKDVSRNVAGYAARETGVSTSVIKKLLPLLAPVVMGALSSRASSAGMLSGGGSSSSLGTLGSFLDFDNDGSVVDDVLNIARRFF